jgi:hypothetical protein
MDTTATVTTRSSSSKQEGVLFASYARLRNVQDRSNQKLKRTTGSAWQALQSAAAGISHQSQRTESTVTVTPLRSGKLTTTRSSHLAVRNDASPRPKKKARSHEHNDTESARQEDPAHRDDEAQVVEGMLALMGASTSPSETLENEDSDVGAEMRGQQQEDIVSTHSNDACGHGYTVHGISSKHLPRSFLGKFVSCSKQARGFRIPRKNQQDKLEDDSLPTNLKETRTHDLENGDEQDSEDEDDHVSHYKPSAQDLKDCRTERARLALHNWYCKLRDLYNFNGSLENKEWMNDLYFYWFLLSLSM